MCWKQCISRMVKQVLHMIGDDKRDQDRQHITWRNIVQKDIKTMDIMWKHVCFEAMERYQWKKWAAQCVSYTMD